MAFELEKMSKICLKHVKHQIQYNTIFYIDLQRSALSCKFNIVNLSILIKVLKIQYIYLFKMSVFA